MPQNRFFRPSARLARKNGSENPQPAAWQTDSEILTFERAEKTASEEEKRPLSGSEKPLGRSRLPFRKAVTRFSASPHKQSAATEQAICPLRTSIPHGRNKHGRRTELARWPLQTYRKRRHGLCFAFFAERPCRQNPLKADFLQAFCRYSEQSDRRLRASAQGKKGVWSVWRRNIATWKVGW